MNSSKVDKVDKSKQQHVPVSKSKQKIPPKIMETETSETISLEFQIEGTGDSINRDEFNRVVTTADINAKRVQTLRRQVAALRQTVTYMQQPAAPPPVPPANHTLQRFQDCDVTIHNTVNT
eukprot:69128_1